MPSEYVTLDSPLTLDSPDLCRRMETYWANVESTGGFEPSLPKAKHPLREFFEHEGIIDESSYPSDGMIDNEIHPIFHRSNWRWPGCDSKMDAFYEAARPALRLASRWIDTDSSLMDWWVHVSHGERTIHENGSVYLAEHPAEKQPNARHFVRGLIKNLAGTIPFTLQHDQDMNGASGRCFGNLQTFATSVAPDVGYTLKGGPQSSALSEIDPVIVIAYSHYHSLIHSREMSKHDFYVHQFDLACTLVHELSHAIHFKWNPFSYDEPFINLSDTFPEAGKSWEVFVFGAQLTASVDGEGMMHCQEMDHYLKGFGLNTVVPTSWLRQWWLKGTWNNIEANRSMMLAPSIRRDTSLFVLSYPRIQDELFPDYIVWERTYFYTKKDRCGKLGKSPHPTALLSIDPSKIRECPRAHESDCFTRLYHCSEVTSQSSSNGGATCPSDAEPLIAALKQLAGYIDSFEVSPDHCYARIATLPCCPYRRYRRYGVVKGYPFRGEPHWLGLYVDLDKCESCSTSFSSWAMYYRNTDEYDAMREDHDAIACVAKVEHWLENCNVSLRDGKIVIDSPS
jgi:hypothetical protein